MQTYVSPTPQIDGVFDTGTALTCVITFNRV